MSDQLNKFESLRMRAIKLAAMAARGEGNEAEIAKQRLKELMERYGLTEALLTDEVRTEIRIDAVVNDDRPCVDKDLTQLAVNCLAFVLQRADLNADPVRCQVCVWTRTGCNKPTDKVRTRRYQAVHARLTAAEAEDWKACYEFYKPAFLALRKHLRLQLKKGMVAFLNKHGLAPKGSGGPSSALAPAELSAIMSAMSSVSGDSWQQGARLMAPDLHLTDGA